MGTESLVCRRPSSNLVSTPGEPTPLAQMAIDYAANVGQLNAQCSRVAPEWATWRRFAMLADLD